MDIKELRQLTPAKMSEALKKARRDLAVKKFHIATGQDQKTSDVRRLRKLVARILTLLNNQTK